MEINYENESKICENENIISTGKFIDHLKERHLNLELHRPIIDTELSVATFLFYNFSHQIVGYQQYNPNGDRKIFNTKLGGKYYTYRKQPTVSVWGLESYYICDGPIFITEGIFDAARLTTHNQTAFAVCSNNPPKDYKNWFKCLSRSVIAICDNDSAGQELAKFGNYYEIVPDKKDLGESSEDYIQFLIARYNGPL
jgi:hypothetical protein